MKKILITGGCGFIGSNLTEYFLKKNYKVIVLDKYNFQNNWGWLEKTKHKNLEIKLGDIRDFDFVNKSSSQVFNKLANSGILVRQMDVYSIKNSLRVTIGKSFENKKLILTLRKIFHV